MSIKTIDTEGAIRLVEAIVDKAKQDFITFKEGTELHEDAKRFFLSEHFYKMTGFNGEKIIRDLMPLYEQKQKKKGNGKQHADQ